VEVDDIDTAESNNWMIRMLQSKAFSNVPTSNLHRLFLKMDSIPMRAGESVVHQGEPGDHFYVVQAGNCVVKRRPRENAPEIKLAELGPGDSFGEEALIAGKARNASVAMITDGRVMRLGKSDFMELVKDALVREVDARQANSMQEHGAVWIDLRDPAEFERASIPGAVNIELAFLREECANLDRNQTYMVCSDSPTRSACGAFLLAAQGIDVCSLDATINEYLLGQGLITDEVQPTSEVADVNSDEQESRPAAEPDTEPSDSQASVPDGASAAHKAADGPVPNQIDPDLVATITRDVEKRLRAEMEDVLRAERRRWEVEMQARFNDYKSALKAKVEKQQQELKAAYRRRLEQKLRKARAEPAELSATGDSRL
jgi:rhodanese-related sulfurtransferase